MCDLGMVLNAQSFAGHTSETRPDCVLVPAGRRITYRRNGPGRAGRSRTRVWGNTGRDCIGMSSVRNETVLERHCVGTRPVRNETSPGRDRDLDPASRSGTGNLSGAAGAAGQAGGAVLPAPPPAGGGRAPRRPPCVASDAARRKSLHEMRAKEGSDRSPNGYRSPSGMKVLPFGPTYSARGRMRRLSDHCSSRWAVHPAVRLSAKIGVKRSGSSPSM